MNLAPVTSLLPASGFVGASAEKRFAFMLAAIRSAPI
jgi:hypothetical protein